jgi:HAMP domain-containing protein
MTIRQKLFLILGLSQVFLILALFGTFAILIQSVKNEPQNKRAEELSLAFEKELKDRQEFLKSILKESLQNGILKEKIQKSQWKREKFLEQDFSYIERLKTDYQLNILEIGDPKGKVFHRFHRPKDFGDDKIQQPIIRKALLENQISSTMEIGHSGMGLRAAGPISGGGTLLIGQIVDKDFASSIAKNKDIKIAFFQDEIPLAYSDSMIEEFLKIHNLSTLQSGTQLKFQDKYYYVSKLPYNSEGLSQQKMNFIILIDETLLVSNINKIWLVFGFIAVFIFSCILSVSYFFSSNIIQAIKKLNHAMKNIENDESHTKIDLSRKDEIGEMGKVFLSMKEDITNYQNHLEQLVDDKTKELNVSLQEIKKLKELQDGDYYLTSLLLKPLSVARLQTENVKIESIIRQKKKFHFKNKTAEIGGDLCVANVIQLKGREYSVFMNADAMGKSIQGAGGALVLGTVFKSMITRTNEESIYADKYPERWLKDCFKELQNVFISFDGSMLLSAVFGLIDNELGTLYYINAEHPWMVLYRDDKAEFISSGNHIHKIGLQG